MHDNYCLLFPAEQQFSASKVTTTILHFMISISSTLWILELFGTRQAKLLSSALSICDLIILDETLIPLKHCSYLNSLRSSSGSLFKDVHFNKEFVLVQP